MDDDDEWGVDVREELANASGMHTYKPRRSPARLPAGTVRNRGPEGGCLPVTTGVYLSAEEHELFGLLLREFLSPLSYGVSAGHLVTEQQRAALHDVVELAFGCRSDVALWLVPYMTELRVGRSERFAAEVKATDPARCELLPVARGVHERTRRELFRSAPQVSLPTWLTEQVTVLLLKKFSFAGGGGPDGALSEQRIMGLLQEPRELAAYLSATPVRARIFAAELSLLAQAAQRERTRPRDAGPPPSKRQCVLADEDHATPKERRAMREAPPPPPPDPSLSVVHASSIRLAAHGFFEVVPGLIARWWRPSLPSPTPRR